MKKSVTSALLALATIVLYGCNPPCVMQLDEYVPPPGLREYLEVLRATAEVTESTDDIVVGSCGNADYIFVFRFTGPFSWQYEYFDSQTGEFVAVLKETSDVPPFFPCTANYWPDVIQCQAALITEIISGSRYAVGDAANILP